jgi:hypothetical protein
MFSTTMELLPEVLQVLFFGSLSAALSVGGAYVERFAFVTLQSGETVVGAWAAAVGVLLVGFGILLLKDHFRPGVHDLREHLAG